MVISSDGKQVFEIQLQGMHGKGKTPIADGVAAGQKDAIVALAKLVDSERDSDQHPVSNLAQRAHELGFAGKEFATAFAAAVSDGLIIHTPDCGPKQLGVFKLPGR